MPAAVQAFAVRAMVVRRPRQGGLELVEEGRFKDAVAKYRYALVKLESSIG